MFVNPIRGDVGGEFALRQIGLRYVPSEIRQQPEADRAKLETILPPALQQEAKEIPSREIHALYGDHIMPVADVKMPVSLVARGSWGRWFSSVMQSKKCPDSGAGSMLHVLWPVLRVGGSVCIVAMARSTG